MTTAIPVLLKFSGEKLKEYRRQCAQVASYSFEHALFIGGHAAIAYGVWMIWHPMGPIVGGWFAIKLALLVSSDRK